MLDMYKVANKFKNDHLGKGEVSKVTDYSFTYTTTPIQKDKKPESCVYMLSWFMEN